MSEALSMAGRILIVEDEEPVRSELGGMLERGGYSFTAVADSASAREVFGGDDFALLVCDMQLPGESGLDLLREVHAEHPDLAAIMVTSLDESKLAIEALELGAYGYLIKPFTDNQVLIGVANALRRRGLEIESRTYKHGLEQAVHARTEALRAAVARLEHSAAELRLSREETVLRFSRAVEYRDPMTHGHVERMSGYCGVLASCFGLDRESISIAAAPHDVGKVGVTDYVLLKNDRLTPEEREHMQRHTSIGYELLTRSGSGVLELAATIAWTHHEKFDGSGYPRGLSGEDIPLEGRVAAVADVFDALTSDRTYRPAMALEEAIRVMTGNRGTHFDPRLLDVFLDSLDEIAQIKERFSGDDDGAGLAGTGPVPDGPA